jgi:hypothetical protein
VRAADLDIAEEARITLFAVRLPIQGTFMLIAARHRAASQPAGSNQLPTFSRSRC